MASYIVDSDVIGYASDWLDSVNDISIAERFAATDSLASLSSLTSVTKDSVDANELLASIVLGQVTDVLEAAETVGFITTPASLEDSVASNDLLTGLLQVTTAATDRLTVTDELDGQRVEIGEPFESPTTGEQYDDAHAHPRCRCSKRIVTVRTPDRQTRRRVA
jgi:hypothetical protein